MIRITCATGAGSSETLTVEGNLMGAWVPLLEAECLWRLDKRKSVELDFARVGFIDRTGVAMVQGLVARGVRVVGASCLANTLLGRGGAA